MSGNKQRTSTEGDAVERKPDGKPSEAKSAPIEAKSAPTGAKPAPAEDKPAPAEAKPAPVEARPAPVEAKPAPAEAKPPAVEAKPAPVEAKPPAVEANPAPAEARSAPVEAKPAAAEAKPAPVVFTIPPATPDTVDTVDAVDVETLPDPTALPTEDPEATMAPPGVAPAGDARSLRGVGPDRAPMFALVYRVGTSLVVATGRVGKRGSWQATDYPSTSAASHAYANACGSFTHRGYIDFRR
jgi:hypothetical protein